MQCIRLFSQAGDAVPSWRVRLARTAAPVLLAMAVVAGSFAATAVPTLAQTTNQSYNCGGYGAGNYGSNDCLAAAATPTPPPSVATPMPTSPQLGGLPVTGAQLLWGSVMGLVLILLGIGLSLRRKRVTST